MKDKKLSRKEKEALIHKESIIETALELFSEKGFHNVSMQEIAHKAEFAVGTIYKFFANKEELYKSLMLNKGEEFHKTMLGILDEKGEPEEILSNYLNKVFEMCEENTAIIRLISEKSGSMLKIRQEIKDEMRSYEERSHSKIKSLFLLGIEQQKFRKLSAEHMAIVFSGLFESYFYKWLEEPEKFPLKESVPGILDIFWEGVLKR